MRFWLLPLLALSLAGQTPSFEVASIRPSGGGGSAGAVCRTLKAGTEQVQATGISLGLIVIDAYETETERFELPDWMSSRFDVNVKMPPGANVAACREMLRNLLAERFHMEVAIDSVEMPTYFLKVGKGGFKYKSVDGPPADLSASSIRKPENGQTTWTFRAAPMSRIFIPVLADIATGARAGVYGTNRVIDETGLTGYYDGELQFRNAARPNADGPASLAPSLEDALIDQAGLILELRKAPAKVLTIRSSDRMPTEN